MHYALHAVVFIAVLWNVQDVGNASKIIVSPDVLTTFAKNVASAISPALLGESQPPRSNRSSTNHADSLKTPPIVRSPFDDPINRIANSKILRRNASSRYDRIIRDESTTNQQKKEFNDTNLRFRNPDTPQDYTLRLHKSRDSELNDVAPISKGIDDGAREKVNNYTDNKNNTVNADASAAPVHRFDRYQLPGINYRPALSYPLAGPGHHGQFGFNSQPPPNYDRYPNFENPYPTPAPSPEQPSNPEVERVEDNTPTDPETSARSTFRPYDFDRNHYHYPPYYSSFYGQPASRYPGEKPYDTGEQTISPENGQPGSDPSVRPNDQPPNGPPFRDYGYDPRPFYRPGYYGGFYGVPGFYHPPDNSSAPPNQSESGDKQSENNSTDGPYPNQPDYRGYGFNPYQPVYPVFPGYPHPYYPPQNPGAADKPKENDQGDDNSTTTNQPPYGYPPFRPLYGSFHLQGYPSPPFNFLPYGHFNNVFNDNLTTRVKAIPNPSFYSQPYPHFSHPSSYPSFPGLYPNYNFYSPPSTQNTSPKSEVESPKESSETAEAPINNETEVISESKSNEVIRASGSNRFEKFSYPWIINQRA